MSKISLKYKLDDYGKARPYGVDSVILSKDLNAEDSEKVNKKIIDCLQYIDNIYSQAKYKKAIKAGKLELEIENNQKVKIVN